MCVCGEGRVGERDGEERTKRERERGKQRENESEFQARYDLTPSPALLWSHILTYLSELADAISWFSGLLSTS